MRKDSDAFGPLPEKPAALFDHPKLGELYDFLAMDLHAMKYAEQCVKEEREACAKLVEALHDELPDSVAAAIRARGDRMGQRMAKGAPIAFVGEPPKKKGPVAWLFRNQSNVVEVMFHNQIAPADYHAVQRFLGDLPLSKAVPLYYDQRTRESSDPDQAAHETGPQE